LWLIVFLVNPLVTNKCYYIVFKHHHKIDIQIKTKPLIILYSLYFVEVWNEQMN